MKTNAQFIQLIRSSPVFAGYTEHGAEQLMEAGTVQEFPAGQVLFKEGDVADFVLLVLAGRISVYVQREREVVLAESGPGSILGELAVLGRMPRAASVRTAEPSTVLSWPAEAFRRLLLGNAFLAERIFGAAIHMLVEKERTLIEALTRAQTQAGSVQKGS